MTDPSYLNRKTFANRIGSSLRHFDSMKSSGRLPRPVKFGSLLRWTLKEIEAWESAGCPTSEKWEKQKLDASAAG